MKDLKGFKNEIHKCSKCALCQAECPIYKITGNDCSVSRGLFVMLEGVIKGELELTKDLNRYLDLCLKCGACSKFCPSGIDVVDVIIAAKNEHLKKYPIEKLKTFLQKYFIIGLIPKIASFFNKPIKSKTFEKKVVFFGGCSAKLKGKNAIIKILNKLQIEVLTPNFHCCGISYLVRGDLNEFNNSIKSYIKILKKTNIKEIVTTCASCEKSLKDYIKWADDEDKEFLNSIQIKNIYEYLKEQKFNLTLKKSYKITYHKPCNIDNYVDIKIFLNNIQNLEYIEMDDFNKCCGLNGITKFKEYKIMKQIFKSKRNNIRKTGANIVLTSCLGCETALKIYSFGKYKVQDLIEFISKNI